MKVSEGIPTATLLKRMGFNNEKALAKSVNTVLTSKENYIKYIVEETSERGGRPEKFLVTPEAKTIVQNIALLQPYSGLFGRSKDASIFAPRVKLQSKKSGEHLRKAAIRMKERLSDDILRSQQTLECLGSVTSAIINNLPIDIEKDSIEDMIQKAEPISLSDFSNSYLTGQWNDIVELRHRISGGEHSSHVYRLLGEKLFLMGDIDGAKDVLHTALEVEHDNGVANALLALIYNRELFENRKEQYQLYIRTEFSGTLESPLTSEEHWINDNLEYACSAGEELKKEFIHYVILALEHWPEHEYRREGKKNFLLNLSHSHDCYVSLSRWELFMQLIKYIDKNEWDENREALSRIVPAFVESSDYGFHTKLGSDLSTDEKVRLLNVVYFYSPSTAKNHLAQMSKALESGLPLAPDSDYEYFENIFTKALFIEYFGDDAYDRLISRLLDAKHEHERLAVLSSRASRKFDKLGSSFSSIEKIGYDISKPLNFEQFFLSESEDLQDEEGIRELKRQLPIMLEHVRGWKEIANDELWMKFKGTSWETYETRTLILSSCLIELASGENARENTERLNKLLQEPQTKSSLTSMPERFLDTVCSFITNTMNENNELLVIIKKLRSLTEDAYSDHDALL